MMRQGSTDTAASQNCRSNRSLIVIPPLADSGDSSILVPRHVRRPQPTWRGSRPSILQAAAAFVVSLLVVLLVWPSPSAGAGAETANNPRAMRLVIDAEPQHLNPLLDPDLWGYRVTHDLICEPLIRPRVRKLPADGADPNSPESFEGVLAERFRQDKDGLGIDLWIRKGVRFHDGHILTAHDVRVSLEMVLRASQSAPRTQALLADVTRVLVSGSDVVHLDLRRSSGRIWSALAALDVVPASQFPGEKLTYQPFNRRPVCTGPFRLAEWKRGSQLVLKRFASYWGPPAASEELRFLIVSDGAHGLARLRQGEADAVLRVAPRYVAEQIAPAVARGRWHTQEIDASQVVTLLWNPRHPLLGNPAVRRALTAWVDRARLLREVRGQLGSPQSQPLLGVPTDGPPLSLEAAGGLLDQAGAARLPPAGPRQYLGRPLQLRVLIPSGSSELTDVAHRLSDALARAGLKLDSEVVDLPTLQGRLRRGAYDMALLGWSWTGEGADMSLDQLVRLAYPEKDPTAQAISDAWTQLRYGADPARAQAHLLSLWQSEQPLTLIYRPRQLLLMSAAVRPLELPIFGDFVSLRSLTLDSSKPRGGAEQSDR